MMSAGTILAWLGGVVSWHIFHAIWKHYYGSYLDKKGANRADREDIRHLTELVESVKSQFSAHLEEQKFTNQLRMAALDKRLQAHQEAFARWRRMLNAIHDKDQITAVVADCEDWWDNNCLYLEPAAREAFADAYMIASQHRRLLEDSDRNEQSASMIVERWKIFTEAPATIIAAVALPGLTRAEVEEIQEKREPA